MTEGCPCGCGGHVSKGRTYATAGCHATLMYERNIRSLHSTAIVGAEVDAIFQRLRAATPAICPACGSAKANERRCSVGFLLSAEDAEIGYSCRSCSAEYVAKPGGVIRFVPSGVYVLRCEGFIKIGITTHFQWRRRYYLTDNPFPIDLVGFIPRGGEYLEQLEARAHQHFAALRHRGEWFRAEPPLLAWIDKHATRFLARIIEECGL